MVPRLALYGATSTALAAVVVGSAVHTRANFFAAAVTLGRSSGSLMVLANFALFNVICFGIMVKKIFFGQLRTIEYEHLFERLWMFLTESLLALTIFRDRDDFSAPFIMMYSVLLFLKCFHWITADRVDYMDQVPAPGPPTLFHIRVSTIITILFAIDILLVKYSLETITYYGVSSMVLLASEFMILLASIAGTTARYSVGLIDLRRARGRADAPSWEEKSMYLFYIDLAVDFMKLLTYLCFFTVILLNYGLPLHILRDVYMTLRSFLSRCSDLIRYRRATRDMDALYPNATAEELHALGDQTCIICREDMAVASEVAGDNRGEGPNETPKRLACGHVFHFHCLRSWLERQQSCPTCRRDVLRNTTTNNRSGPAAPARAPAAGQAPVGAQATAAPDAQPRAAREPLPTPLQAMYNEFFRPAGETRPAPGPAATAIPPASSSTQTEAERIQTGIWGGPIAPGSFHPRPLGAGPSRSYRSRPESRPSLSPITTQNRGMPNSNDNPNYTDIASRGTFLQSGSSTPFSSNPPQVFSSPGLSRQLQSAAITAASTGSTEGGRREGEVDDESDDHALPFTSVQRRVAAEAAMRRLGLTVPLAKDTVKTPAFATSDLKGKGKAIEIPEDIRQESLDDAPKHIPYLTSALPPPHPQTPSRPWTDRNISINGLGRDLTDRLSEAGAALGLEERLQVLRDVDEVIWGLMGELTQVKSRWEAEDADEVGGDPRHGDSCGDEGGG